MTEEPSAVTPQADSEEWEDIVLIRTYQWLKEAETGAGSALMQGWRTRFQCLTGF